MQPKINLKKDKFKQTRGKYSRALNLYCRKCKNLIGVYQKDGPGNLRRLYFDRFFYPDNLVELQNKTTDEISELKCPKCGEILGTPFIYKKENRKAFRLYVDAIIKKIRKI